MKNKKLDTVGILCGLFLVLVLVANIVLGNRAAESVRPKIPDTAMITAASTISAQPDIRVLIF